MGTSIKESRPDKDMYYLAMADVANRRSTCLRRHYGAVVVKDDVIVSTGYNGACRGELNCSDVNYCEREDKGIPSGTHYELCKAVHAEMNAIISAGRDKTNGGTLYITGRETSTNKLANPYPCKLCRRVIKNAGIQRVVGLFQLEDESTEARDIDINSYE